MAGENTNGENKRGTKREATLGVAILLVVIITAVISLATTVYNVDVSTPIATLAVVIALVDYFWIGMSHDDILNAGLKAIMTAMPACMIVMLVGVLIGVWMRVGVIPGLISYGLNILSPSYFPFAAMLISAIISICTGSSWSTEGTIGVALMGIGHGLGVPAAMTAGCVVSGASFGDKMSPLSDTTNLAPGVAGNDLFDHIRAMFWTTGPTLIICAVVYIWWGWRFAGATVNAERISAIQTMIAAEFSVSWLCVIPPLVIVAASVLKIPSMPSICLGIFAAVIMAFFQGVGLGELWELGQSGYKAQLSASVLNAADVNTVSHILRENGIALSPELAQEAVATISRLVSRGGMLAMMWDVEIVIVAMSMGGFLDAGGFLTVLVNAMTKAVRRVGGLVMTIIGTCFVSNLLIGSQYLSIIIPGRMFRPKFDESGLAPRMLSRSLEDSGTLTSVLVPWNACGAYAAMVLGVRTLDYAPYAILNWLNPIVAIVLTYLGIGVFWRSRDGGMERRKSSLLDEIKVDDGAR